jgi:hypothetical protein
MTTKRTKGRLGPFERGRIDIDSPSPEDADAVLEVIKAASSKGRIATWRPHADRLGVACELLDQAEALLDDDGYATDFNRFDALMVRAVLSIERAQNESLNVYGLAASRASHSETLRLNAEARNEAKRRESGKINAQLIAWDNEVKGRNPHFNQARRADKIKNLYSKELPQNVRESEPESIAKRIRDARKKHPKK